MSQLVKLMRDHDPDPTVVARTASACLAMPRDIGPRDYVPPSPLADLEGPEVGGPGGRRGWGPPDWLPDERRATAADLDRLDHPDRFGYGGEKDWPEPLNTVSPLRDFADLAGRRFQQILLVVRGSFPGLPEPTWVWQSGQ